MKKIQPASLSRILVVCTAIALAGCSTGQPRSGGAKLPGAASAPPDNRPPSTFHVQPFELMGRSIMITSDPVAIQANKDDAVRGEKLVSFVKQRLTAKGLAQAPPDAADLVMEIRRIGIIPGIEAMQRGETLRFKWVLVASKPAGKETEFSDEASLGGLVDQLARGG